MEATDQDCRHTQHPAENVGRSSYDHKAVSNVDENLFPKGLEPDQRSCFSNETILEKSRTRLWKPTFLQLGTLSGILAMFTALACLIASLGILAGSDGQAVSHWHVPPATYLAISTAVANLAMRYAAVQGVLVAWWLKAMQGSSLSQLHNDWRSGSMFRGALTSGRNMGLLGLACIFSTIVVIDGPLLQRASTVIPSDFEESVSMSVAITPEIPSGYTGPWVQSRESVIQEQTFQSNRDAVRHPGSKSNDIFLLTSLKVLNRLCWLWYYDTPQYMVDGCPGQCKAKLIAPALAVTSSTSYTVPTNGTLPEALLNPTANAIVPALNSQAFMISSQLIEEESETIRLVTGYSTSETCRGDFSYTVSYLKSAIGEYEMTIDNNNAGIANSDAAAHPRILSLANNTRVSSDTRQEVRNTTLAGIVDFSFMGWADWVSYFDFSGFVEIVAGGNGAAAQYYYNVDGQCQGYQNPHDAVIASLNRLMVNTGWTAATNHSAEWLQARMDPGIPVNTTATGHQIGIRNAYHTNYWFFFGAAVVEVVCILFVAPTYWGWWKLGRPVSFSPLEIAKAFEAPLLAYGNSNSCGSELARQYGEIQVQYGKPKVKDETGSGVKLAFAEPGSVHWPRTGEKFTS